MAGLEHLIMHQAATDSASFRYNVRMYTMGCLMAVSSEPYMKGTIITPDTRYGDIATIFLSDVSYCATSLRKMGDQLKKEERYGEAVVVKENVVALNDLDFLSPPDTQISNSIQGSIDLGMVCFDVGNYDCSAGAFTKAAHIMTSSHVENDELCGLIAKVAASQFKAGNYSDAAQSYQQALRQLRKLGSGDKDMRQKNYVDAESTYRTALELLKSTPQKNFKLIATTTKNLATCLYAQRMWIDAAALYEEALNIFVSMISDADPDPQFHSSEFSNLLDTVVVALTNAADDTAKAGNYRDAHALRERAAQASKVWSGQGNVSRKNSAFLDKLLKSTGVEASGEAPSGTGKRSGATLAAWLFRLVFAGLIGLLIYIGVTMVDWSEPLTAQFEGIKKKLLATAGLEIAAGAELVGEAENANWSSVPTPERFPGSGGANAASGKSSKPGVAPSPDRYFSKAATAVISPPRQQKPVYIPSE